MERGTVRKRKIVWLVDGTQLIRAASYHLRELTDAEQLLVDVSDTEASVFQDLARRLRQDGVFVDLPSQSCPPKLAVTDPDDHSFRPPCPPGGASSSSSAFVGATNNPPFALQRLGFGTYVPSNQEN